MNPMLSRRTILAAGAVAAVELLSSQPVWAAEPKRRVVVWSEKTAPKNVYPHDINGAVAEGLEPLEGQRMGNRDGLDHRPRARLFGRIARTRPTCSSGGATNATARSPTSTSSGSSIA